MRPNRGSRPGPPRGLARARPHRPRRLAVKTVFVCAFATALLFPALPAVAAANRKYEFQGHSVHTGECQSDVKVSFTAELRKTGHGWHAVTLFRASGLNFPNVMPPIPFGSPTGHCYPGPNGITFVDYSTFDPAIMLTDSDHPTEFNGKSHDPASGTLGEAFEAWVIGGNLSIRRVHHRFKVKAWATWASPRPREVSDSAAVPRVR